MTPPRLLLVGALLAGTVALPTAFAASPAGLANGPLGDPDDVAWMLDLEQKLTDDNFQYGKAVAAYFADTAKVPGTAVGTGGWGDSGLWNGVYVGGQALRYATAKAHLAALGDTTPPPGPTKTPGKSAGKGKADSAPGHNKGEAPVTEDEDARAFWLAQRDEALAKIREGLWWQHLDINIAEDWQGELRAPAVDPSGYPAGPNGGAPVGGGNKHLADFGGGVIKGQKGMIMRACTPKGATGPTAIGNPTTYADKPVQNNDNRVFSITWHVDNVTYNCETSPSRDTYAGLTFGLLTTYDLVAKDFPEMAAQIRADLQAMGDFLVGYGWSYPRPHGYVSAKHDFDSFISPLFVQVPMARLNLTNAVRHVLADSKDAAAKAKWDGVWAEELASQGPILAASMQVDSLQPNDGYYKFNLHHLTAFNLLRTLTGPERDLVAQAISVMDNTTRDDLNAHFEAITYSQTGDPSRLADAITHLREWKQYRRNTGHGQVIQNSTRCGNTLVCVPQDQYELVTPAGDVTWFPGTSTSKRAARPLPVADRAPSDFIWQRPPTQLNGQEAPNGQEPGVDYLTPYWMLRYYTEVQKPANTPFPTWVGPATL